MATDVMMIMVMATWKRHLVQLPASRGGIHAMQCPESLGEGEGEGQNVRAYIQVSVSPTPEAVVRAYIQVSVWEELR